MRLSTPTKHIRQTKQKQRSRFLRIFWVVLVLLIIFLTPKIAAYHSSAHISEIKSGIDGYCLDVHRDDSAQNATVDSWQCNGTAAQEWAVKDNEIVHNNNDCLSIQNNGVTAGDKIVSDTCNGSSGQDWASAIDGYENPATAMCLGVPNGQINKQLILASCDSLTEPSEAWAPATWNKDDTSGASTSCSGSQGQEIACYAAKQWVTWQSGSVSHQTLLNNYSDGNGYEEWCADFVSYVYKQAGYPFANGERNDWDEYLADNIQNMGFTYHSPDGYTPQPGDVAYFDYPGGHVEIVAIGGPKPLFIYGDSGTIDPSTGNGSMTENSITNTPSEGQLEYYLSPN